MRRITLKLHATLTDYLSPAARSDNLVRLDVEEGATIAPRVPPFQPPPRLTHLVLVNGLFLPREERGSRALREGDVLAIWPPINK